MSHQLDPKLRKNERLREFQIWKLEKKADFWLLTCWEDTGPGERPKISQKIEYSDFPLDSIDFYVENGVLFLPDER